MTIKDSGEPLRASRSLEDMVDRVAMAIFVATGGHPDGPDRNVARAAVEAMREPTEAMADLPILGGFHLDPSDAKDIWNYMIDAALTSSEAAPKTNS